MQFRAKDSYAIKLSQLEKVIIASSTRSDSGYNGLTVVTKMEMRGCVHPLDGWSVRPSVTSYFFRRVYGLVPRYALARS